MSKRTTTKARKAAVWLIEWEDSILRGSGAWIPTTEAVAKRRKKVRCYSAGFLLASDKAGVVVATSAHAQEVSGVMVIPRRAILRMKKLR